MWVVVYVDYTFTMTMSLCYIFNVLSAKCSENLGKQKKIAPRAWCPVRLAGACWGAGKIRSRPPSTKAASRGSWQCWDDRFNRPQYDNCLTRQRLLQFLKSLWGNPENGGHHYLAGWIMLPIFFLFYISWGPRKITFRTFVGVGSWVPASGECGSWVPTSIFGIPLLPLAENNDCPNPPPPKKKNFQKVIPTYPPLSLPSVGLPNLGVGVGRHSFGVEGQCRMGKKVQCQVSEIPPSWALVMTAATRKCSIWMNGWSPLPPCIKNIFFVVGGFL